MFDHKFKILPTGLSLGILWALCIFFLGVGSSIWGTAIDVVIFMGRFYVGFAPTFLGVIIGTIWGFLDAFVGGILFAWLYNKLSEKF